MCVVDEPCTSVRHVYVSHLFRATSAIFIFFSGAIYTFFFQKEFIVLFNIYLKSAWFFMFYLEYKCCWQISSMNLYRVFNRACVLCVKFMFGTLCEADIWEKKKKRNQSESQWTTDKSSILSNCTRIIHFLCVDVFNCIG